MILFRYKSLDMIRYLSTQMKTQPIAEVAEICAQSIIVVCSEIA